MKSINIKSLTLMMLITVVYARPHVYINRHNGTLKKNDGINVTKETLLKEIKEEAKHILSNAELCSKSVTFIKSINGITCVPNFFCYARKSLSIFKDEEEEKDISVLKRYLYQYIKVKMNLLSLILF
ncbi:hypothetical protein PAMA_017470 [Pampus argenteus]